MVESFGRGRHPESPLPNPFSILHPSCSKKWEIFPNMSIKILLADDHALVRKGLRRLLETKDGFCVVGEATNGREAIALVREYEPDIVFMDISMPVLDGIEATRRIRHQAPSPLIIILSMYASNEYVQQALDAGAHGYVLKSSVGADVIPAIQKIMAGRRFFSPKIVESMAVDVSSSPYVVESASPIGAV